MSAPTAPAPAAVPPATQAARAARIRKDRLGHYAAGGSRLAAMVVDVNLSAIAFTVTVTVIVFLLNLLFDIDADPLKDVPPEAGAPGYGLWLLLWFGGAWALAGKTVGQALFGLRVVKRDGTRVTPIRALLRAPALALTLLTMGLGFIGLVIGREYRGLHDVLVGTVVVYDWDPRHARLRAMAHRQSTATVTDGVTTTG
jgi:uncharacterized RDD family membrane protein YckC